MPDASQQPFILIVEDDQAIALLMGELLSDEGYASAVASNAAEALAVVVERRPGLIVLDMVLQDGVGGLALLERLRADPRTAGIPVLLCSGGTVLSRRLAQLTQGNWDTLPKPFEIDDFAARIHSLLDRQ